MLPSAPSARPHPRGVRPQRAHIATHVDLQVGDLESAVAEAVARGATVAGHQPQENVRVLIDPAGHPPLPLPRRGLGHAATGLCGAHPGSSGVHPAK